MEKKLGASETKCSEYEALSSELQAEKQALQALLDTTRTNSASELKRANAQLDEKKKALKAINVALADTPENVVKKIKVLNKKKFDEAAARKQAEDETRALKKEKQELQDQAKQSDLQSAELVEQHRELRAFCESQYEQLKKLVEDEGDLQGLPEFDEDLLGNIESTAES